MLTTTNSTEIMSSKKIPSPASSVPHFVTDIVRRKIFNPNFIRCFKIAFMVPTSSGDFIPIHEKILLPPSPTVTQNESCSDDVRRIKNAFVIHRNFYENNGCKIEPMIEIFGSYVEKGDGGLGTATCEENIEKAIAEGTLQKFYCFFIRVCVLYKGDNGRNFIKDFRFNLPENRVEQSRSYGAPLVTKTLDAMITMDIDASDSSKDPEFIFKEIWLSVLETAVAFDLCRQIMHSSHFLLNPIIYTQKMPVIFHVNTELRRLYDNHLEFSVTKLNYLSFVCDISFPFLIESNKSIYPNCKKHMKAHKMNFSLPNETSNEFIWYILTIAVKNASGHFLFDKTIIFFLEELTSHDIITFEPVYIFEDSRSAHLIVSVKIGDDAPNYELNYFVRLDQMTLLKYHIEIYGSQIKNNLNFNFGPIPFHKFESNFCLRDYFSKELIDETRQFTCMCDDINDVVLRNPVVVSFKKRKQKLKHRKA